MNNVDYEDISNKNNVSKQKNKYDDDAPDEINDLFMMLVKKVNLKIALLLFVFFIIINTSVFIDKIMSGFGSAVIGDALTEKGIFVQGLFLVIFYMLITILDKSDII